jgi:hypothetical protein
VVWSQLRGCPIFAVFAMVGIFGPFTLTFLTVAESKPPPFENHRGWATPKSQTAYSALTYWSGIIRPCVFVKRKNAVAWASRQVRSYAGTANFSLADGTAFEKVLNLRAGGPSWASRGRWV